MKKFFVAALLLFIINLISSRIIKFNKEKHYFIENKTFLLNYQMGMFKNKFILIPPFPPGKGKSYVKFNSYFFFLNNF
jgi:hypothetical protein